MRIAVILEYDGSGFCGWQLQPGVRTVQGVVEQALAQVADHPLRVITAGRTDTGVHACGQVIHFDTSAERSDYAWVRGGNSRLPADVTLLWAGTMAPSFHARFSATARHYRYVIFNRPQRPSYLQGLVSWEYRSLALEPMRLAASYLIGTHDFSAYRTVHCQAKSPVRELRQLEIRRQGEFIVMDIAANAFLHHMVRNIAGVLMTIGAGERPPQWALEVLQGRDRCLGGVTATAHGLYLRAVDYPEKYMIPRVSPTCALW